MTNKKLLVLKPRRLRNFWFFLLFSYYNFVGIVFLSLFWKYIVRILALLAVPVYSMAQTLIFNWKPNPKVWLFVFIYQTVLSNCLNLVILLLRNCQETLSTRDHKRLRNFQYWGPTEVSYRKVCTPVYPTEVPYRKCVLLYGGKSIKVGDQSLTWNVTFCMFLELLLNL